MSNTARRIRRGIALTVGAVAIGAGSMLVAAPAQAATPDTTNVCGPSNAWVAMLGSRYDVYLCGVATANTTGLGPFSDITSKVTNRIWLHQYSNNTGLTRCYRGPGEWLLSGWEQNPGNIQVSANTAPCP